MNTEFFWRIPMHGDGRSVFSATWNRGDWKPSKLSSIAYGGPDGFNYFDYAAQVARAVELAGFDGALVPTDFTGDEPLITAAALARETRKLRMMTAFQPGFISPAYACKMSATLQRISGGRLDWNIITGGSALAQRAYGDPLPHDQRYARTDEWLEVVEGVWKGAPYNHEGKLYQMENGGLVKPLAATRKPLVYFSGASDVAMEIAARHADFYMTWMEPLPAMQAMMAKLNGMAAQHGRRMRYGLRVDLFARETEEQAWAEARRLWDSVDHSTPPKSNPMTSAGGADSVGAKRQSALREGARNFDDFIIGPNLWSGLGAVRPGPTVGIFGSYEQVADRLAELAEAGFDNFILAANPHLEEALRIGEYVLPLVRQRLSRAAVPSAAE